MGKQKIRTAEGKATKKQKKEKTQKETAVKVRRKKKRKEISKARVYVNCSYNNTVISFADYSGNVFAWSSSGCAGFSGSKKGTAFAATKAAYDAYDKAAKHGVREAVVVVKGVGIGRRAAVKGLRSAGLIITLLTDETPVPHDGCRPRKRARGS
jgi:small subunit ribosomal protein S11